MKIFITVLLVLCLAMSISACSEEESNDEVTMNSQASILGGDELKQSDAEVIGFEISVVDLVQQMAFDNDLTLIDVREPEELQETGIIEGSIHIPLGSLTSDSLQQNKIHTGDKVIAYCRSGNRSKTAYQHLTDLGYLNAKSLKGGIKQWQASGNILVSWDR